MSERLDGYKLDAEEHVILKRALLASIKVRRILSRPTPAMMSDETELVECRCPERLVDMACYGIHICRDGKRIAPEDFYAEPPEDADAAARAALSGEAQQKKGT